jgi:putative oxidoreductase
MDIGHSRLQPYFPGLASLESQLSEYAYPLMRFWAGAALVPHGCQKLFEWFGGNTAGTAAAFAKIGLEPALPLVYLTGSVELIAGLLVALGLFTRVGAVAALVLLSVAWYMVHLPNGYFWTKLGTEYPMLWSVMMIGIAFGGGGKHSLDAKIGKEI